MLHGRYFILAGISLALVACGGSNGGSNAGAGSNGGGGDSNVGGDTSRSAAECAAIAPDAFVTRTDLVAGTAAADADLMLRFVHFTDDHIIDDEAQAINGAGPTELIHPTFESAMRLQEEYSDELLNDMITRVNDCHAAYPAEFAVVTGDSADLTTVAEARRFIDNMDGSFDQMSAFEESCRAGLPEGTPEELAALNCTRFTGRGVADTQTVDPDPQNPTFQFYITRVIQQILNTEQAALTGRAADGSVDPARETFTRSPGMPEQLRCEAGMQDCINNRLAMPWYIAFGNHDAYFRGAFPLETGPNELALATGRHYMFQQHEFIDEFFFTQPTPGPIGHGFQMAEAERRGDADPRNDGYYAFDAGNGRFRMIVLNTIIDGTDPRLPTDLIANPAALSDGTIDGAQFEWLKGQLAAASAADQLVMIFSHHADLTFAEFGMFAALVPPLDVSATQLDAELASWPNVIAWVAGHTHLHRVRAFKVTDGIGSNGAIETEVACKGPGTCTGFWQIESASLIDFPQEQRLFEIFDNGDGTGVIRAPVLTHTLEVPRALAEADDRCQFYLTDPEALADISDAGMDVVCNQGQTRQGTAADRNVELIFAMP